MAKGKPKKRGEKKRVMSPDAKGLFLLAIGFLSFLALATFTFQKPSANWLGYIGYIGALGAEYLFGLAAYLFPAYSFWVGVRLLNGAKLLHPGYNHLYFSLLVVSSCMLLNIWADTSPAAVRLFEERVISETLALYTPFPHTITRLNLGGVPFYYFYADLPGLSLARILSPIGCALLFSSCALVSLLLLTGAQIGTIWQALLSIGPALRRLASLLRFPSSSPAPAPDPSLYSGLKSAAPKINLPLPDDKQSEPPKKKLIEALKIVKKEPESKPPKEKLPSADPIVKTVKAPKTSDIPIPTKSLMVKDGGAYQLPSPSLLSPPNPTIDQPTLKKDLMRQAAVLEETLKSFGIEAKVGEINSGPTITSFEVHPSIGVKVQKIKALENDIALNMQAKSIRIVAPIPGKAAVGVEVPALHPQEVNFRELLLQYQQQKGKKLQIPILLGKAVNGDCVFSDLARMPHCLIAGATGSGKSVCINTIVMSILMNARPDEIKLLMVDPKKVELTQYSRLPHMIAPVITEPHGAYAALHWLVKEMQVRYEILKQLGLRNISAFNTRKIDKQLEASLSIPIPEKMPLIVAIVDEFADLMMVSSADIETPIARIAQMARAVGIHLILATQRPSREVITGIIKANIPTRISFKVASRINSQIILDEVGAESLLGNGDLLFLPPGSSQLIRAQGVYVSDDDINKVIHLLCQQHPTNYLIPSFDSFRSLDLSPDDASDDDPSGKDALYDQALSLVLASKCASTTFLQRKLKIGYARAASLMDELEANGVIGPQEGAKPRRILSSLSPDPDLLPDETEE
jgi:S-DNA-T family DNA segregation ATPase FtsK/SpoIIIE